MDEIRKTIDKMMLPAGQFLSDDGWAEIEAAIRKAQPTSVGDIYAALRELAKARGEESVSVRIYNHGRVYVYSHRHGETVIGEADSRVTTAIRSLIPKPEPTPEEDLKTVKEYIAGEAECHRGEYWKRATDALARIRKRLDEMDWSG